MRRGGSQGVVSRVKSDSWGLMEVQGWDGAMESGRCFTILRTRAIATQRFHPTNFCGIYTSERGARRLGLLRISRESKMSLSSSTIPNAIKTTRLQGNPGQILSVRFYQQSEENNSNA